jgi:hypothetical protein
VTPTEEKVPPQSFRPPPYEAERERHRPLDHGEVSLMTKVGYHPPPADRANNYRTEIREKKLPGEDLIVNHTSLRLGGGNG